MKYRRRGVVLLLVLVVVTMLAYGSLVFAELMLGERRAAQASARQAQARAFAESGAELARQFLNRTAADQLTAGGLYDNAQRFSKQIVAEDDSPREQGRFTIVAPKIEDTTVTGTRYGLQDESARINLTTILNYDKSSGSGGTSATSTSSSASSTANSGDSESASSNAHAMLMGLPSMTDDIADAILDWIDADDTPRENGAESETYSSFQPPYAPRNAPPVSIEELLLVRGVTPGLLFGLDAAKMGYTNSGSTSGGMDGVDNSDGSMDHGWAAYLTLWSAESTLKADGTQKINVNDSDLQNLHDSLSSALDQASADFIVAYRLGGGTVDGGGNLDTSTLDGATARNTIGSFLDLIDATVEPKATNGSPVALKNPFTSDTSAMSEYLPKLFDNCTTVASGKSIPGRININQAPRTVLMCIPGMTSDIADQIIANRQPDPASSAAQADQTCPAWPLIEGIVPLATMKSLMPYITAGGSVYRAQVIGQFDKGNPVARLEVILDASQLPTRVLFWKDMSHLKGGFPGETSSSTTGER